MNSEGDYTLCNLDAHSYSNAYNGTDNPASLYGYSTINNRSIDTGQHGYYDANINISHGMDLSLINGHVTQHQNLGYTINGNNSMMGRSARNTGYQDLEGQLPQCLDPYTGLAAINCDTQTVPHGGVPPHSPGSGRSVYGSPYVDTMGQCSIPNGGHNVCFSQMTPPSPVKSESPSPQNLQSKPFRWMQIKRNPGKTSKFICHFIFCTSVSRMHLFPKKDTNQQVVSKELTSSTTYLLTHAFIPKRKHKPWVVYVCIRV